MPNLKKMKGNFTGSKLKKEPNKSIDKNKITLQKKDIEKKDIEKKDNMRKKLKTIFITSIIILTSYFFILFIIFQYENRLKEIEVENIYYKNELNIFTNKNNIIIDENKDLKLKIKNLNNTINRINSFGCFAVNGDFVKNGGTVHEIKNTFICKNGKWIIK